MMHHMSSLISENSKKHTHKKHTDKKDILYVQLHSKSVPCSKCPINPRKHMLDYLPLKHSDCKQRVTQK